MDLGQKVAKSIISEDPNHLRNYSSIMAPQIAIIAKGALRHSSHQNNNTTATLSRRISMTLARDASSSQVRVASRASKISLNRPSICQQLVNLGAKIASRSAMTKLCVEAVTKEDNSLPMKCRLTRTISDEQGRSSVTLTITSPHCTRRPSP